ncbi:hypothetical protein BDFG_07749 [Blastomyces dermatitidis ATCC 26199]|nr:hypothetical protein BDFG_07749 [Blastomyces dermatitidis ATCC 26199]
MLTSHVTESSELCNSESDYTHNIFSDDSNSNTDMTEKTDSENSENSKNSDEKSLEDDKLSSLKHYETEKTTLDVKCLQQHHLKKEIVDNINRV